MIMAERRNYWSRAAVSAGIVKWLKNHQGGGLPPGTDPRIAERVLKRLAWRGLATKESGTWKPTPPLVHPTPLTTLKADT
jgi:hypothetical protein